MVTSVTKIVNICAAHLIPNHPGKCARPHGHNYKIEVTARGEVNPRTGMVIDFYHMKEDIQKVIELPCDHMDLNQVYPGMLTTAENLAQQWLLQLSQLNSCYVRIRVWETDTCYAEAAIGV